MKKFILLLVGIIVLQSLMARSFIDGKVKVYLRDGSILSFVYYDVDSIRFSKIDTSNIERDDYVVQEIFADDSLYRIPLADIDSACLIPDPKPIVTTGEAYNVTETTLTVTGKVKYPEGYKNNGGGFIANFMDGERYDMYQGTLFELCGGEIIGDTAIVLHVTGLRGNTYYIYRAYVYDENFKYVEGEDRGVWTKAKHSCPDDNHPHLIDLGLPSGTKWACCNLDSNLPSDFGRFYAWGETSPKYDFMTTNYQYASGEDKNGDGFFDDYHEDTGTYGQWQYLGDDIAGTQYDAAHVKWGGTWSMPTAEQFQELLDSCTWVGEEQNGNFGYKVTGPNGNSIYLPETYEPVRYYDDYKVGIYWTSSYSPEQEDLARGLQYGGLYRIVYDFSRYYGRGIRPVCSHIPPSIKFADAAVKEICIANWDTNGDGELQYPEAEAVESLGDVFRQKQDITSFEELRFFKGLTSIGEKAFMQCSNLSKVTLPKGVKWIEEEAFSDCALTSIILPDSLIGLGEQAFEGNPLVSITLPSTLKAFYTDEEVSPTFNSELMTIRPMMKEPFECDERIFTDETYAQAALLVPKGTKTLYETTRCWSRFQQIEESEQ